MAIKKRGSSSVAAGVAKKRRTVHKQCKAVAAAVLLSEDFPAKVLKMVSGSLADCLGVPKEDRHDYQSKVIRMAGEALKSAEASIQKNIEAAEGKLSSTGTEKASREGKQEAAAALAAEKVEALQAAKVALADSTTAIKSAKAALSEATTGHQEGNLVLDDAAKKKVDIESMFNEAYVPVKEGSVAGVVVDRNLQKLRQMGKLCVIEPGMLDSLEQALRRAPALRETFDRMVCTQFEDEVNKQIKELDDVLATAESKRAELNATLDAARAGLESAKAHGETCKNSLVQSQSEVMQGKAAHSAAIKNVSEFGSEMKQVEKDLAKLKTELEEFSAGALADYKDLVDYTAIAPAAPVEPEGASTADAAQ